MSSVREDEAVSRESTESRKTILLHLALDRKPMRLRLVEESHSWNETVA